MSEPYWRWLESTYALQQEAFGIEPDALEGDEFADYITLNCTALLVELGEFMQEIGWKTWAEPRGWTNRDAAVKELIDVAHFLANLACALGLTDEEWEERYRAKQDTNRRRQTDGYDGVSSKCPGCRRALDDSATMADDNTGMIRCACGRLSNSREFDVQ